jgi:hypothetical protein
VLLEENCCLSSSVDTGIVLLEEGCYLSSSVGTGIVLLEEDCCLSSSVNTGFCYCRKTVVYLAVWVRGCVTEGRMLSIYQCGHGCCVTGGRFVNLAV